MTGLFQVAARATIAMSSFQSDLNGKAVAFDHASPRDGELLSKLTRKLADIDKRAGEGDYRALNQELASTKSLLRAAEASKSEMLGLLHSLSKAATTDGSRPGGRTKTDWSEPGRERARCGDPLVPVWGRFNFPGPSKLRSKAETGSSRRRDARCRPQRLQIRGGARAKMRVFEKY